MVRAEPLLHPIHKSTALAQSGAEEAFKAIFSNFTWAFLVHMALVVLEQYVPVALFKRKRWSNDGLNYFSSVYVSGSRITSNSCAGPMGSLVLGSTGFLMQ